MTSTRQILKITLIAMGLGLSTLGIVACSATPTQESAGQYVDSSSITTQVKAALLNTPNLNSTAISVETFKGVVQLSGFVDSSAQSAMAQNVAQNVSGVKQVVNSLVVKPPIQN